MMVNQQTWGILVDLCWTSWFTSTPGFMVIRFSELVNGVCKSTNLTGGAPCGFKIKPTANPLMNYPSWLRSGYPQIVIIYIYTYMYMYMYLYMYIYMYMYMYMYVDMDMDMYLYMYMDMYMYMYVDMDIWIFWWWFDNTWALWINLSTKDNDGELYRNCLKTVRKGVGTVRTGLRIYRPYYSLCIRDSGFLLFEAVIEGMIVSVMVFVHGSSLHSSVGKHIGGRNTLDIGYIGYVLGG